MARTKQTARKTCYTVPGGRARQTAASRYTDEDEHDSDGYESCECGRSGCREDNCDWVWEQRWYGHVQSIPLDESDSGSDGTSNVDEFEDEEPRDRGHARKAPRGGGGCRSRLSGSGRITEHTGPTSGPLFDLGQALSTVGRSNVKMHFTGEADFLPRKPVIHVDGVGRLTFPLDKRQLERLCIACDPGSTGSVNADNTHELASVQFRLEGTGRGANNDWEAGLKRAEAMLDKHFGVEGITVQPDKLVLHQPGGRFKMRRDPDEMCDKDEGIFAKMVVQLPSKHTGGDLHVRQMLSECDSDSDDEGSEEDNGDDEVELVHDFGAADKQSHDRCNHAIYYADAEHGFQPIKTGHRVLVVYSVRWPESRDGADDIDGCAADGLEAINILSASDDSNFIMFLQNEYDSHEITRQGVGAMRGVDRKRVDYLVRLNESIEPRFKFQLGQAERRNEWYKAGSRWCEDTGDIDWLVRLHNMDGKLVVGEESRLDTDMKRILNPDRKTLKQLWRGHRQVQYGGDDAVRKTTTYHKTVLIATPSGACGVASYIRQYGLPGAFNMLVQESGRGMESKQLEELLRNALEQKEKPPKYESMSGPYSYGSSTIGTPTFGEQLFAAIFKSTDRLSIEADEMLDTLVSLYFDVYKQLHPLADPTGRYPTAFSNWLFAGRIAEYAQPRSMSTLVSILKEGRLWDADTRTKTAVLEAARLADRDVILKASEVLRVQGVPGATIMELVFWNQNRSDEGQQAAMDYALRWDANLANLMWRIGLLESGSTVYLESIIKRTADLAGHNLAKPVDQLLAFYTDRKDRAKIMRTAIEARRWILMPLVQRYMSYLEEKRPIANKSGNKTEAARIGRELAKLRDMMGIVVQKPAPKAKAPSKVAKPKTAAKDKAVSTGDREPLSEPNTGDKRKVMDLSSIEMLLKRPRIG